MFLPSIDLPSPSAPPFALFRDAHMGLLILTAASVVLLVGALLLLWGARNGPRGHNQATQRALTQIGMALGLIVVVLLALTIVTGL